MSIKESLKSQETYSNNCFQSFLHGHIGMQCFGVVMTIAANQGGDPNLLSLKFSYKEDSILSNALTPDCIFLPKVQTLLMGSNKNCESVKQLLHFVHCCAQIALQEIICILQEAIFKHKLSAWPQL